MTRRIFKVENLWREGLPGERPYPNACIPRLRAAENQRVHVVRAFVGVDRFEILRVAHHVAFFLDAVAAVHVARRRGRCRAPSHPRAADRPAPFDLKRACA
jgi:hypothetical protein